MIKYFCIIFIISSVFASKTTNDYYNTSFLGEKRFDNYSGPLDPTIKSNVHQGKSQFSDDHYYNNYSKQYLESDFFNLNSFWNNEVKAMNSCPNFYLNKNISYIRYLYRLITISYLFESIKEHATLSYRLGYGNSTCSLDWNEVFGSCKPKSPDMKRFVQRTKPRYLINYDSRKFKLMNRKSKNKWVSDTLPDLMNNGHEITYKRLKKMCKKGECLSLKSIEKTLEKSCRADKSLIELICSEKDELYGVTLHKEPTKLLAGSNVMINLNKGGFASACLERYGELNKSKEVHYSNIVDLFPALYKKLSIASDQNKYIEGEVFIPGALKEFDDRGLENFLFVKPKVIAKKPVAAPKVIVKKTIKPKPVAIKKVVVTAPPPPKPIIKEKPKELSTFEKARKKLVENNLEQVVLNMKKFHKDFIFGERLIKALEGPLDDYQNRSALNDLLMFDKLGSRASPVRLKFIKFLIDEEKHSGLWNVKLVLGSEFYIFNDIEKDTRPVAVELTNDNSTNNEWQLTLLSDEEFDKRIKNKKDSNKKKRAKR